MRLKGTGTILCQYFFEILSKLFGEKKNFLYFCI